MIELFICIIILIFLVFFVKNYYLEKSRKEEFIERIKIKEYLKKINNKNKLK